MRRALVVLLVLALLGAGGVAFADQRDSGPSYRTATAAVGDVEQAISLNGTISPAGLTDLSFATSGEVAGVAVRVGQRVRRGEVLGRLDARSLRMSVTDSRTTLARARATLASDEAAQAAAVTAAAKEKKAAQAAKRAARKAARKAAQKAAHNNQQHSESGSGGTNPVLAVLAGQQQAVLRAQTTATTAITTAKADFAKELAACGTTPSPSPPASPSDSPTDSPTTGPTDPCSAAIAQVQSDQQAVENAQDNLQKALNDLSTTLMHAIAALNQGGGTSGSGSPGSSGHQHTSATSAGSSSGSSSASSSGSFGGATVTAAQLARDQSSIDAAQAALVAARQSLKLAWLRAPYSGRIVAVDVARGGTASPSSTAFVLVARGVTTVTTTITTSQVQQVEVGQTVRVTPTGAAHSLTGRVSAIGLLPSSSSSSTTYPVTITLDARAPSIPAGATATVSVVIGTAHGVVSVPTSAVTRATRSVVEVLADGKVTLTPVTIGVVGLRRTQIKSGLPVGSTVVLADLSAAVPSNTTGAGFIRFGGSFPTGAVRRGNSPVRTNP